MVLFLVSESCTIRTCPTKRAPDAGDSGAIPSLFYASAFFQSDGVPPPAPARVTQTVGKNLALFSKNKVPLSSKIAGFKSQSFSGY